MENNVFIRYVLGEWLRCLRLGVRDQPLQSFSALLGMFIVLMQVPQSQRLCGERLGYRIPAGDLPSQKLHRWTCLNHIRSEQLRAKVMPR